MNKLLGVAIGLTIAAGGLVTVYKETASLKASRRKTAARKVFSDKLCRAADVAEKVRLEQHEVEMEEIRKEGMKMETPVKMTLEQQLVIAGSWVGLKHDFRNAANVDKALTTAELLGFDRDHVGLVPFIVVSKRIQELNEDWSVDQCLEAGKIAVVAMNTLGDDYNCDSVFLVVDDVVRFEILNHDNHNAVTAVIAAYASKKAAALKYAA